MRYPPLGRCAYCGSTASELSDEHIVPFALGGTLELPAATCRHHQSITSAIERAVTRETYGLLRARTGVPTRRTEARNRFLVSPFKIEGTDRSGRPVRSAVPMSALPRIDILIRLSVPSLLAGEDDQGPRQYSIECAPEDPLALRRLRTKLGWSSLTIPSPPISPLSFGRLLAKVAHVAAVAERGIGAFKPLLLPLIEGDGSDALSVVGGFSPEAPQSSEQIALREVRTGGGTLLVVDISFHFFPRLPRYQVVAGLTA